MTISVHDNHLVSYEVQCERRVITLRTERRQKAELQEFTNVVFEGVQAYYFENDAFGNIIFDVSEVSVRQFLKEYGDAISELYRIAGVPPWASDLSTAPEFMSEQGIEAFILSSSLGLSGWIIAKKISRIRSTTCADSPAADAAPSTETPPNSP